MGYAEAEAMCLRATEPRALVLAVNVIGIADDIDVCAQILPVAIIYGCRLVGWDVRNFAG